MIDGPTGAGPESIDQRQGARTISVVLRSGTLALAVPVSDVRRVMPARGFTSVPLARREVIGVMVLEGKAVPVYRLASLNRQQEQGGAIPPARAGSVAILEREGAIAGFLIEASETVRGDVGQGIRSSNAREILTTVGALAPETGAQAAADAAHGDR